MSLSASAESFLTKMIPFLKKKKEQTIIIPKKEAATSMSKFDLQLLQNYEKYFSSMKTVEKIQINGLLITTSSYSSKFIRGNNFLQAGENFFKINKIIIVEEIGKIFIIGQKFDIDRNYLGFGHIHLANSNRKLEIVDLNQNLKHFTVYYNGKQLFIFEICNRHI